MIDWEFQWHSTPPERFQAVSIALLALTSFIMHKVGGKLQTDCLVSLVRNAEDSSMWIILQFSTRNLFGGAS